MSTDIVAPEIRLFLARVRHELADLDPAEVEEMTDGLEADLTELVAERGAAALGRPEEYAAELRSAAGLERRTSPTNPTRREVGTAVNGLLDAVRERTFAVIDALPGDLRPFLDWVRPLWWIARAWAAFQLAAAVGSAITGIGYYTLEGGQFEVMPSTATWAWVLPAVAIAVSVQLGRGKWWPGGERGVPARVVLAVLNGVAAVAVPYFLALAVSSDGGHQEAWDQGYAAGRQDALPGEADYGIDEQAGVFSSGRWVTNIYAYDAAGKPLTGVQLFDQGGKPISVVRAAECPDDMGTDDTGAQVPQTWSVVQGAPADGDCLSYTGIDGVGARVSYPWTNGAAQVGNVYPLATRIQESFAPQVDAFAGDTPPAIGPFPMERVPPVSLPGIAASVQRTPKATR